MNPKSFKPKTTESEIKKSIVDWLNWQPHAFAWVNFTTGVPDGKGGFRKNPMRGVSDVTCIVMGHTFVIEVKRPGQKATEEQRVFLSRAAAAGAYAIVADSLLDVQECFAEILGERQGIKLLVGK